MKITYNLADIAAQKEMSLSEVARRVQASKSYIWYIANNRVHPTLYMLALIAEALEVPVEALYTQPHASNRQL